VVAATAGTSVARAASRAAAVTSGIGASRIACGNVNQRSRTVSLTSGVAIEIAAMPTTTAGHARRAQAIARACSAPSVLTTSQQAPSSTEAAGSSTAIVAANAVCAAPCSRPVT
jgi:hypothetical protein